MRARIATWLGVACSAALATACTVKEVRVGLDDKNPPAVTILVAAGEDRIRLVGGRDEPTTLKIPAWEEVYVLGFASDSLGVKELAITCTNGFQLLDYADGSLATTVSTTRDTTPEGIGVDRLDAACKPMFTAGEATVRAQATDWAGNVLYSPAVRIIKVPSPTAKLSHTKNWALSGGTVNIVYETTHAETVVLGTGTRTTQSGTVTVPVIEPVNEIVLKAIGPFDSAFAKTWIYKVPNAGTPVIGKIETSPGMFYVGQDYDLVYDVSSNARSVRIDPLGLTSTQAHDTFRTSHYDRYNPITLVATGQGGPQTQTYQLAGIYPDGCLTEWYRWPDFRLIGQTALGQVMVSNTASKHYRNRKVDAHPIIEVKNGTSARLVVELGGKWVRLEPGETTDAFAGMPHYVDKALIVPTNFNTQELKELQFSAKNKYCPPD